MDGREWHETARVARYLGGWADRPWWRESKRELVEHLPERVTRFLDIGTGDGRLIDLVRRARPGAAAVGLDFSPPMLAAAPERFAGVGDVDLIAHDLTEALPPLGFFDLVVSGFAIHHLEDARKRSLYAEVHALLQPGGLFLNLEWLGETGFADADCHWKWRELALIGGRRRETP